MKRPGTNSATGGYWFRPEGPGRFEWVTDGTTTTQAPLRTGQDDTEAVRWYRLATDQGNANAQFILGNMYADGDGVPQDDAEAVRWFRLAAAQGGASAKVGIDRVRAYDLRHTFGTEMYRRTGDPLVVQNLMCHRQASTTARYILAAVPEMVARAIRSIDAADSHGSPAWQSGAEPPPDRT